MSSLYWKQNRALALILLGSFFVSLAYSFYFRIPPVVDAKAYDRIGINLAEGYGFKEDRSQSYEFDHAMTRAGPGYQFFLAGIYTLFGHYYEPVWVAQAGLHALSVWLIYLICLRIFIGKGKAVGLTAALLFAFWPDLIEISAMLLTETLYVFFTVLTVYVFVRLYEEPRNNWRAAGLGAVTGLAILTRPPILLFALCFLWFFYQKKSYRPLLIFLTCLIFTLTPWTVRNYSIYHQLLPTTMVGSYNIWLGNTPLSDGGQFTSNLNPLNVYVAEHGLVGLPARANLEFRQFVFAYPVVFIKLCFLRVMRYFSLIRPMGFWFYLHGLQQAVFVTASGLWIALLFLFGIPGLWTLAQKRGDIYLYLGILAATSPLLLIPTVVESRYRFQLYPFLALGAAFAIVSGRANRTWWNNRPWLVSTITLGLFTLIDILLHTGTILERLNLFS